MRRASRCTALLAAGLVLAWIDAFVAPGHACAQKPPEQAAASGEELLVRCIAAYDELDYPNALVLCEQAIARGLPPQQQVRALDYIGYCHVAQGEEAQAEAMFRQALAVDPTHRLPDDVSPKIQRVFDKARGADTPPDRREAEVALSPAIEPAQPREGQALAVSLGSRDPRGQIASVAVQYRRRGGAGWSRVEAARSGAGAFAATIPGMQVEPPALEYFAEARDAAGAIVARAGSAEAPLTVDVRSRPPRPIYAKWWFWTAVGAGAVVTAVLVGVLASQGGPSGPATVTVIPR
jgi:hypothetical protein